MTIPHGKTTRVWIGGYPLSGVFNTADLSLTNELGETTTFDSNSKTYIAGLEDGTMGFQGVYDDAAGTGRAALDDLLDNDPITTVLLGGDTPITGQAVATGLTTTAPFSDVVRQSFDLQLARQTVGVPRPVLADGTVLFDGVTKTSLGNGSPVDIGGTTRVLLVLQVKRGGAGGLLQLHESAAANFNVSAELLSVAVGGANYAQIHVVEPDAGTARYLRFQWNGVNVSNRILAVAYKI